MKHLIIILQIYLLSNIFIPAAYAKPTTSQLHIPDTFDELVALTSVPSNNVKAEILSFAVETAKSKGLTNGLKLTIDLNPHKVYQQALKAKEQTDDEQLNKKWQLDVIFAAAIKVYGEYVKTHPLSDIAHTRLTILIQVWRLP
jgi:hypothetical protein